MFFQKMSVPVQSTVTISSFLGLDRRARGELGSFREMENLTSDGYPTLTVRPRRCNTLEIELRGAGDMRLYGLTRVWQKGGSQ